MAKNDFYTIEDSRYTMEQAVMAGRANPVPKNWHKMNHVELMNFFADRKIKIQRKPKVRVRRAS
jgi:hypothetical protein